MGKIDQQQQQNSVITSVRIKLFSMKDDFP